MRVKYTQMMAMRDNELQPSQARTPSSEPTDTIHYFTAHTTLANHAGVVYHVPFGPSRSRTATTQALSHFFPRTAGLLNGNDVVEWNRNNHFRWTEDNGDKVLVRIETEKNPVVCGSSADQALFSVIHRVTDYNNTPVSETAEIVGTFVEKAEAAVAASGIFRKDIEGRSVEGVVEKVKDDGLLFCGAQSTGQGGYRWTVEVNEGTWQQALH